MKDKIASGIYIVRVNMTDHVVGGKPSFQLWVAAVPRDEAVAAVKAQVPSHWTVELTDDRPTQEQVRNLNMKLGTVKELSSAT